MVLEQKIDVDECLQRDPVCPAQMICTNTIGSFTCSRQLAPEVNCPKGFRFNQELESCIGMAYPFSFTFTLLFLIHAKTFLIFFALPILLIRNLAAKNFGWLWMITQIQWLNWIEQ